MMIITVATMFGGLGLFLLAIAMITDGLKYAAGDALRDILARSTATPLRGVASGILVTGLVQSSSAVTVATIGFVNAGLLQMTQALGIVYGANIGTTMTGWLVAAIGFEFKVDAFALPLIGLGMAARVFGKATRLGAAGEALAGFGLFFMGIDVLRQSFATVATYLDVSALSPETSFGLLLYVLFGFLTTLVTQSSSAAIAITLTAATGGILALDTAAAMVIGANVGTTSTAIFSVLGATSNAKRVAAAHVIFNLVTGLVAIALLPGMLALVSWAETALGLDRNPAMSLALFHTIFNILGVLLMWPMTKRLAHFLEGRFKTASEALGKPVYLDKNVLITPSLGIDALSLELRRMADLSRTLAIGAIKATKAPPPELGQYGDAIEALTHDVGTFVSSLERDRLSKDMSARLPLALRINNYLEEVTHLATELVAHFNDIESIKTGTVAARVSAYQEMAVTLLGRCDVNDPSYDAAQNQEAYDTLRAEWHDLKSNLLDAAANNTVPVAKLNTALERLRSVLRIIEQSVKLSERLEQLQPSIAEDTVSVQVANG